MLIVALVLAAVGLAALVTAVVTSNEVLAFVCIAAAAVGVVLMIIDAIRDRHAGALDSDEESDEEADVDASESDDADSDHDADGDVKADAAEADPSETSVLPRVSEKSAPAAAVSLKEAATAAHHHPSAEETYEQFDIDDEDEDEPHRP
ncbi:hypothetical protein [Mycobacteroides abscessus]|uniref:Transmembrane protein n=2 Tax=Mycobacteroides abscessus TaxID=36809 RepID=A0A1U3UC65_9MYCO|nr:hypothetical protein [Mycobacteroides abscessus]AGM28609.1 hypothetical protein MASS_2007 [Mycobacteroides abscessus subsp. bolletii 50594]AMU30763.1 hypothetical protein A3N97_09350 [Mycobacteroides abscessus]AMU65528.1 hypothetical protein A3O04_09775 [Mycobacteroides abscessus]ANN98929.1 hypothetical protein BAB74_09480 [Mycobacteroides abscessus]ANO14142.1 hypothetical protein BAB77_10005 [Mycobacteroides abscessus]